MPTPTWDRLPTERRDAIVAAAEAEFASRGFSRGSLNVIAREAGVAKGSLFQYFDDKLDLFAHLSDLASIRIGAAMAKHNAPLPWAEDYWGALTDSLLAWIGHFRDHPVDLALTAAVNLELDTEVRVAVREVVNRHYLRGLQQLIDSGVETGAVRADADHGAFLAQLVLVMPHLALAANMPGLDPVLDLHEDPDAAVARVVAVWRAAFGTWADGVTRPVRRPSA
ncbi:TetR/AcrR family transcriptional regulator [Actinomarinicola tropica]|uniref:TetR family transcriptional regulator n=1 Tax=Actinomarinicola tropica TaxID=2789776 RepID=A0A5Q2RKS6_9ACTN|nr:TetR/AcrR family transcriptional regulator [Actinomarinicola tropica]QGG94460.1 TetR family transcriptional regulator [Actinomarinicola tropica]